MKDKWEIIRKQGNSPHDIVIQPIIMKRTQGGGTSPQPSLDIQEYENLANNGLVIHIRK